MQWCCVVLRQTQSLYFQIKSLAITKLFLFWLFVIRGANVNQLHCMSMSFSLFDAKNFPMIDIQYPHESHESMWKLTWRERYAVFLQNFFSARGNETIQWQIESFSFSFTRSEDWNTSSRTFSEWSKKKKDIGRFPRKFRATVHSPAWKHPEKLLCILAFNFAIYVWTVLKFCHHRKTVGKLLVDQNHQLIAENGACHQKTF